ncbi:GNAT family N-acetyltransferase [Oricola cellulosilytica]|uniref:GNAT family N-acetyltransferase n=1 Tax=Oricola cellulosilytica TaxID=1429082 RepID=UPI001304C965|nr:GNAT family N-acetyltransferase [Oricola cellulosilytica]
MLTAFGFERCRSANKLAKAGNVRLYVMVSPRGDLIGFYALNAHAVDYRDIPARYARNRPGHGAIPAAYISMIGRDRRFRGGGFGADLLADALRRIEAAAGRIGIALVKLDVLDCGDPEKVSSRKAIYQGFGFQPLPSNPLRMFLPIATVRLVLAEKES